MQSMKAFVPSRTKGLSPLTHGRASQIRTEETKDAITPARSHQRGASTKARMDRGMRLRFVLSGDGVSSRLARTTCLVHRPRSLLVLRRTYWERSTQERREQLASRSHRQPQARVPRSVAAPPSPCSSPADLLDEALGVLAPDEYVDCISERARGRERVVDNCVHEHHRNDGAQSKARLARSPQGHVQTDDLVRAD